MGRGEIISNINPERISWCCREFNCEPEVFATKVKIPVDKLKTARLTYCQLENVAQFFGYGLLFFLEPGVPVAEEVHTPEFRTLANQGMVAVDYRLAKFIKQVEWHRDVYLSLLEDLGETPDYSPPELTGSIATRARIVREWLGLNLDETFNFNAYRKAVEAKGILVFQSMGYPGKWRVPDDSNLIGFSIKHDQVPIILVRKTSDARQTFTLFHELGHLLLHQRSSMDHMENIERPGSDEEIEANKFAGMCLLPGDVLETIRIPEEYRDYDQEFAKLSKKCGISVEVIVRRLFNENKVSRENCNDYRQYKAELNKKRTEAEKSKPNEKPSRKCRYREPLHIFGKGYVGTVLNALHDRQITLKRACDHLDGLKTTDLYKLNQHLV